MHKHTILFLILALVSISLAQNRNITIAVVKDGFSAEEQLVGQIETELQRLVKSGTKIKFKTGPQFDARWENGRMRQVILNALKDREVDMILAVGSLVTQEAAKSDLALSKPLVSTFVQRADITGISYQDDQTLKNNFSMIIIPQRAERDIRAFQQLFAFKKLHIAISRAEQTLLTHRRTGLMQYEDSLGIELVLVPISDDITGSLAMIDSDAEAFLLTRIPHLTISQRQELIAEINTRKIPSFSLLGHSDVEMGVLAALAPDISEQIIRRVALNLHRLIRGETTDDLAVTLTVDSRLLINGRTAGAIGYFPSAEMKVLAQFIHEQDLEESTTPLNFAQTLKMAEEGNVTLSITDTRVETSLRDQQRARSFLLPQINAGANYNRIKPRSETFEEFLPDAFSIVGVTVSQMLYDDKIVSDLRSSSRQYEAEQHKREIVRLNALTRAGEAYLNLVLTYLFSRIEGDNVRLTEDNLELSRLRVDVGYSGRDEVFRWQAELAQNQSTLIESMAGIESRQINLNQVLGIEQNLRWQPEAIEVDPEVFYFLDGRLDNIYDNRNNWEKFRSFSVEFAFENAAELKALERSIEAQDIQVGQRQRQWFLPTFSFNFRYGYELSRTPAVEGIDRNSHQLNVRASYPLFNGARRYYDIQREKSVLTGFERQQQLVRDRVERRTRNALRQIESSFPTIKLRQTASENARQNLVLVQDKYGEGIINVTDLLEAQNQNLTASLNAVAAVYQYLLDLVSYQRAISWFEDEKSEEEKEAFLNQAEAVISSD